MLFSVSLYHSLQPGANLENLETVVTYINYCVIREQYQKRMIHGIIWNTYEAHFFKVLQTKTTQDQFSYK